MSTGDADAANDDGQREWQWKWQREGKWQRARQGMARCGQGQREREGGLRQQGVESCREGGSMFPMLGDESPSKRLHLSHITSDLRGVQKTGTRGPCMQQQTAESDAESDEMLMLRSGRAHEERVSTQRRNLPTVRSQGTPAGSVPSLRRLSERHDESAGCERDEPECQQHCIEACTDHSVLQSMQVDMQRPEGVWQVCARRRRHVDKVSGVQSTQTGYRHQGPGSTKGTVLGGESLLLDEKGTPHDLRKNKRSRRGRQATALKRRSRSSPNDRRTEHGGQSTGSDAGEERDERNGSGDRRQEEGDCKIEAQTAQAECATARSK